MRINRNFDMVSCFNDRIDAPVFQGSSGIFLDIHEDPSGDYLISRLNESLPGNKTGSTYQLRPYLAKNARYDGVYLNNGQMSEGQAMEELMKKSISMAKKLKKNMQKNTMEKRYTDLSKHLCSKELSTTSQTESP